MDNDFNMQPVVSGNLSEVGFNPVTSQIRVAFNSGAVYEYSGCTQEEADAIINAPSANDAFTGILRGIKPYRRIN